MSPPGGDVAAGSFADREPGTDGRWMAGRTALVTGGGLGGPEGGVGYAIAVLYARHGARVAVLDRDKAAAEATVDAIERDGGTAVTVLADVTDDDACHRAVAETLDRFGGLDTLVNNVASGDRAGLFDVDPGRWDELVEVNLKSAWAMTRHAAPAMTGGGAIVNISSVGTRGSGPGMVYSMAKAGVEYLTRGASATLAPRGIRVNCVQIGAIWSAMAARNLPPESREQRRRAVALRTEGTCWDPAYAALFLASDRARWVSGHVLTVDGGGFVPAGAPAGGTTWGRS